MLSGLEIGVLIAIGLLWLAVVVSLAIALGARNAVDPERIAAHLRARFEEAIAEVHAIRASVTAMADEAVAARESARKQLGKIRRAEQAAEDAEARLAEAQQQPPPNGAAGEFDLSAIAPLMVK